MMLARKMNNFLKLLMLCKKDAGKASLFHIWVSDTRAMPTVTRPPDAHCRGIRRLPFAMSHADSYASSGRSLPRHSPFAVCHEPCRQLRVLRTLTAAAFAVCRLP